MMRLEMSLAFALYLSDVILGYILQRQIDNYDSEYFIQCFRHKIISPVDVILRVCVVYYVININYNVRTRLLYVCFGQNVYRTYL